MGIVIALRLAPASEPRTARLGASEVAAVLGMSRFSTPLEVWERKTGRGESAGDNKSTRRGRFLEAALIPWLADETGAVSYDVGSPYTDPYVVGESPIIGAHPDCYLRFGEDEIHVGECKTARDDREWGEEGDEVPDGYYVQVQLQLYCTGLRHAAIGCYLPRIDAFRVFHLQRDDGVIGGLVEQAERWWRDHVVAGRPPEAMSPDELSRQLAYRYPREKGAMRPATEVEAEVVSAYARAKRAEKAAIAEAERIGNVVRGLIGNDAGLLVPGGKTTWTAQETTRTDVKRLQAERPEVAAEFSTTTTSRVLRVNVKE